MVISIEKGIRNRQKKYFRQLKWPLKPLRIFYN